MEVTIDTILKKLDSLHIHYLFTGNINEVIVGLSSLKNYKLGTMTWCKSEQYYDLLSSDITLIITGNKEGVKCKNVIVVDSPKKVFFILADSFFYEIKTMPDIGVGTFISEHVKIGKNVKIGHNCSIDGSIIIGDNTIIYDNVTIINTVNIGNNCIIQSGTVIGHDDLGYTEDAEHNKHMIKHYGGVVIQDDVFVGAMCAINRGTIDNTVIGSGTKIDAMCHISHNVLIGAKCTLVSGTRLYGSVELGSNVYIASSIIENQIKIGDNAIIGMNSVVRKNVGNSKKMVGIPAREIN